MSTDTNETPLSRVRAFQRAANPNRDYQWLAEEAANIGGVPLYFDDIEALASTDELDAVEVAIRRLREAERDRDAARAELERQRAERDALVAGYDKRGHEIAELRRDRDVRQVELEQMAAKLAALQAALELAARTGERLRHHAERYRERAEQAEAELAELKAKHADTGSTHRELLARTYCAACGNRKTSLAHGTQCLSGVPDA